MERVLQVVRHRRDAAAPDGRQAPAPRRPGVSAPAGDQVVRLGQGLRQELLQVVNAWPRAGMRAGVAGAPSDSGRLSAHKPAPSLSPGA